MEAGETEVLNKTASVDVIIGTMPAKAEVA